MEPAELICDLKTLVHGEYPPMFKDIPEKYQEDFKSWTGSAKQQQWDGAWQRAWSVYNREYIHDLINTFIEENTH